MKFFIALATLISSATAVTVSYDTTYDNSGQSLSTISCSDGSNGLLMQGFTTFRFLPDLPYIGGAAAVAGWNSPNYGMCWQLTYNGETIMVLAIDHADNGINVSLEAMNTLTNGQAIAVGWVDAQVMQVEPSQCGM
ncbi:Cerato-platanin [Neolentinus lepideus HHB14362 ss-1]|uniref:Cerato-platanin n=1 Tax=Neolentinus lepideus HHB14362 ss-1 TaxID=1314782 RepID=A0A165RMA0_9AGAM|nr:Cerato-platanin [Neolentinus lepideus HHB14362 ss-1]